MRRCAALLLAGVAWLPGAARAQAHHGKGELFQADEHAELRTEPVQHVGHERMIVDRVLDTHEIGQRLGDILQTLSTERRSA